MINRWGKWLAFSALTLLLGAIEDLTG